MLFASAFFSATSLITHLSVLVIGMLLCFVGSRWSRYRLKAKIENLFRVTMASKVTFVDHTNTYARYQEFRHCRGFLERALRFLEEGNLPHAEELYKQAEQCLGAVPQEVLRLVRDHARGMKWPKPVPEQRSIQHPGSANAATPIRFQTPIWDVNGLVSSILDLNRDNHQAVIDLMAPTIVQLLENGGEGLAYERMRDLRDALKKVDHTVDPKLSTNLMKVVATSYLEGISRQPCNA